MLHAAFLRSTVPHGRLLSVDVSAARELPGVVAVYTGEDMAALHRPVHAGRRHRHEPDARAAGARRSTRSPPTRSATSATRSPWWSPRTATSPRTRSSSSSRTSTGSTRSSPTTTRSIPRSRRCSTSSATTSRFRSEMTFGDVDAAFAEADRVVTRPSAVHRHQPVPMESRGSSPSATRPTEQLTIHSSTQSPHMIRMLLPAQVGVPMEKIRVLADDVGGGFGLKNGVHARRRGGHRRVHRPRPAGEVDRGPARAPGRRRSGPRGDGRHRGGGHRRRRCSSASAWTPSSTSARTRATRSPARCFVGSLEQLVPGAHAARGHRGDEHGGVQQQGDLRRRTADRGRPATSSASACSTSSPASSASIRSRCAAATTCVRDEPPLAMLTGQPFLGVTTQEQVEQAARRRRLGRLPRAPARPRERGSVPRASAWRRTSRPRPARRSPARTTGRGDHGQRDRARLARATTARCVIVTRQQPHGQGHETTLAQVAADELGVRFEDVKVVVTATPTSRPFALVGTGGSRAATMANGVGAPRVAGAAEQDPGAGRRRARGERRRPRDPRRRDLRRRARRASRSRSRELARIVAEEPERLADGADRDLLVTSDYDGGQSGWSGGTHVLRSSRSTSRPASSRSSATSWSRTAACR